MSVARGQARPGPGLIVLLVVGVLLWLAFWGQLVLVVPPVKRHFDEFGLKVPDLTGSIFSAANVTVRYWWLAGPGALVGAVCYAVVLAQLRTRPQTARAAVVLAWLFVVLMTATNVAVAGSLIHPWMELQKGLAK